MTQCVVEIRYCGRRMFGIIIVNEFGGPTMVERAKNRCDVFWIGTYEGGDGSPIIKVLCACRECA